MPEYPDRDRRQRVDELDADPTLEPRSCPGVATLTSRLAGRASAPVSAFAREPRADHTGQRAVLRDIDRDPFADILLGPHLGMDGLLPAKGHDSTAEVQGIANRGIAGPAQPLPHLASIQAAFGHHDVAGVRAHIDGAAIAATSRLGAAAYATGRDVAFGSASPTLHTAAHEAAHVVQQRGGVRLKDGLGQVGDSYEQHADAVADAVVRGGSAVHLLDAMAVSTGTTAGASDGPVQRQPAVIAASGGSGSAGQPAPAAGVMRLFLSLPPTPIGRSSRLTASFSNDSDDQIAVDSIVVSNRAFKVDLIGSNVIGPRGSGVLEVMFAPTPPMIGPQNAMLTVELQDGARITGSITGTAEPPAQPQPLAAPPGGPSSPVLDLEALRRAGTAGQCGVDAPSARCDAGNHGQALLGGVRAVRVHNHGTSGEFRDPVATTLYPGDLLEITVDLAGSSADFARIEDTARVLATHTVERRGVSIVLVAEAKRLGKTFTTLTILSHGEEVARLPYGELSVIPALADDDERGNRSQRVMSTDINDAIGQLRVAVDSVFGAQRDGVNLAKTSLLQRPAKPRTPWYAELFAVGAEAAISFVTAGVGNRLGRAVAKWSMGVRDLDLGRVPLFDWESAFGGGLKDSLKRLAREHLLSSGQTDGMTVDEQWAIDLFCAAQISALDRVRLDLQGELNNGAKAYRDLEASHPGLGLSAVEAHRHALAETKLPLKDESAETTVREWLKSLARATHGELRATPSADASAAGGDTAADSAVAGSDLGRGGRGHLVISVRPGEPGAPADPVAMSVAGVDGPAPTLLRGTVHGLGLPIEVHLATMVIKRNEAGQVWIQTLGTMDVLGGNLSGGDQEYLFARGTGRTHPADSADFRAGIDAGAEALMIDVLAMPVKIP